MLFFLSVRTTHSFDMVTPSPFNALIIVSAIVGNFGAGLVILRTALSVARFFLTGAATVFRLTRRRFGAGLFAFLVGLALTTIIPTLKPLGEVVPGNADNADQEPRDGER